MKRLVVQGITRGMRPRGLFPTQWIDFRKATTKHTAVLYCSASASNAINPHKWKNIAKRAGAQKFSGDGEPQHCPINGHDHSVRSVQLRRSIFDVKTSQSSNTESSILQKILWILVPFNSYFYVRLRYFTKQYCPILVMLEIRDRNNILTLRIYWAIFKYVPRFCTTLLVRLRASIYCRSRSRCPLK